MLVVAAAPAAAAMAGWALASGVIAGDPRGAAGPIGLLGAVAIVSYVGAALDTPSRRAVTSALLWTGAGAGLVGWLGVVLHASPIALVDQGLWRAAGTVTYANALAGLLVPLALVALVRSATQQAPRADLLAWLLLAGAGATLSRGGGLGLAAGVAVLAWQLGVRTTVAAVVRPAAGALVTVAALGPSMAAGRDVSPVGITLAVVGLAMGAAVALGRPRIRVAAVLAALAVAGTIGLATGAMAPAWDAVRDGRLRVGSADREQELRAAWQLAADHPVTGVGPGRAGLFWTAADGTMMQADYAHNEYLQVVAEMGLVGGLALAGVLLAVAVPVARGRRGAELGASAGALAALTAFAVQSGLDFLWHVTVLPLIVVAIAAIAVHPSTNEQEHA